MSENYSNSNRRGSIIAKSGFKREDDVVRKFNNWQEDKDARAWLVIMGYNLFEIECVEAKKISRQKTDIQVRVRIQTTRAVALENISVKLVSNRHGFNQVDKRWVDAYAQLWDMPNDIVEILKLFTGEKKSSRSDLKDPRRMFFSEMEESDQKKIINFFSDKKVDVISDILKGRGEFAVNWMLVILASQNNTWILKHINEVMNFCLEGEVKITVKGSLRIGKITMQRKGGDAGRQSANMLQFKMNPAELFPYLS